MKKDTIMKKAGRILLIIVVLAGMARVVVKRQAQAKQAQPYGLRPLSVHVAEVTQQPLENAHNYLGVVEAWQVARVSSRITTRVDIVSRSEGDAVKAGDLLLQLDDSDIQAQIKAAEAAIEGLEANRAFWVAEDRRDHTLAQEGVIAIAEAEITRNRLIDAASKLATAQRTLESLSTTLRYTRLTSPFDGVITARVVDPGDSASPNHTLMVVEDHATLKIAFEAPQEDMQFLQTGLPVRATVGGKRIDLAITRVYPSLNHARMVRVEVQAPGDAGFQIGAFTPLQVVWLRHENAITVPRESLMQRGSGDWFVFTVANGKLVLRAVEKIMEGDGRVEVSALQPGEQVVISTFLGWANLTEGLSVEVME